MYIIQSQKKISIKYAHKMTYILYQLGVSQSLECLYLFLTHFFFVVGHL